jgi:predicted nucleic acid-binding protein
LIDHVTFDRCLRTLPWAARAWYDAMYRKRQLCITQSTLAYLQLMRVRERYPLWSDEQFEAFLSHFPVIPETEDTKRAAADLRRKTKEQGTDLEPEAFMLAATATGATNGLRYDVLTPRPDALRQIPGVRAIPFDIPDPPDEPHDDERDDDAPPPNSPPGRSGPSSHGPKLMLMDGDSRKGDAAA